MRPGEVRVIGTNGRDREEAVESRHLALISTPTQASIVTFHLANEFISAP